MQKQKDLLSLIDIRQVKTEERVMKLFLCFLLHIILLPYSPFTMHVGSLLLSSLIVTCDIQNC